MQQLARVQRKMLCVEMTENWCHLDFVILIWCHFVWLFSVEMIPKWSKTTHNDVDVDCFLDVVNVHSQSGWYTICNRWPGGGSWWVASSNRHYVNRYFEPMINALFIIEIWKSIRIDRFMRKNGQSEKGCTVERARNLQLVHMVMAIWLV